MVSSGERMVKIEKDIEYIKEKILENARKEEERARLVQTFISEMQEQRKEDLRFIERRYVSKESFTYIRMVITGLIAIILIAVVESLLNKVFGW